MESTTGQGEAMPSYPSIPPSVEFPPPSTPPVIPGNPPATHVATPQNPSIAQPSLTANPPSAFSAEAPASRGITMPPEKPQPTLADTLLAFALITVGFFFWEWHLLTLPLGAPTGIGATLIFLATAAAAFVYLHAKGIRPTVQSLLALLVVVLGALPFVLYGGRDINIFLAFFEFVAILSWIALACQTTLKPYLSGFVAWDALRQMFVVPFRDFVRIFAGIGNAFRGRIVSGKVRAIVWIILGLVVSLPLLVLTIVLLSSADDGFRDLSANILQFLAQLELDDVISFISKLIGSIPIACYLFGLIYGSYRDARHWGFVKSKAPKESGGRDRASANRCSGTSTTAEANTTVATDLADIHAARAVRSARAEQADVTLAACHKIPRPALYAPLVSFVVLYLMFFVAMGSYLFSALQGQVPASFTYAQYARQGFFELCSVAFINVALLGAVYLFGSRKAHSYPRVLRTLTGVLSACTCLLIATAMSKMYLYVQTYGLTPLRLYTSWFMVVLMVVFVILVLWHIRPFNAARPLIVAAVVLTLALGLTNTNGLIAEHNVNRYLSSQTSEIDITQLQYLRDAAVPALCNLADNAPDREVRENAEVALEWYRVNSDLRPENGATLNGNRAAWRDWSFWNVQAHQAEALVNER